MRRRNIESTKITPNLLHELFLYSLTRSEDWARSFPHSSEEERKEINMNSFIAFVAISIDGRIGNRDVTSIDREIEEASTFGILDTIKGYCNPAFAELVRSGHLGEDFNPNTNTIIAGAASALEEFRLSYVARLDTEGHDTSPDIHHIGTESDAESLESGDSPRTFLQIIKDSIIIACLAIYSFLSRICRSMFAGQTTVSRETAGAEDEAFVTPQERAGLARSLEPSLGSSVRTVDGLSSSSVSSGHGASWEIPGRRGATARAGTAEPAGDEAEEFESIGGASSWRSTHSRRGNAGHPCGIQ